VDAALVEFDEKVVRTRPADLSTTVAQALADGKVVGWYEGRMEWGPRALGNRSILADPRRDDMKDVVNHAVKLREGFRPFAPACLAEKADEWFELEGLGESPFMLFVIPVHEDKTPPHPRRHPRGRQRPGPDGAAGRQPALPRAGRQPPSW
jgi:carbamoyltransferase